MNGAHIHLLLNHVPILGSVFALCLLLYGIFFKNRSILYAGLVTVVVTSLIGIPAFLSGEEAEHMVEPIIGINREALEEHEDMAEIAFWAMLMNGVIALGTLSSGRKTGTPAQALVWLSLSGLLLVTVLMARTGGSGGEIRHTEIHLQQAEHD